MSESSYDSQTSVFILHLIGVIVGGLYAPLLLRSSQFLRVEATGRRDVWACWLGIGILVHACGQGLIARWLGGVPASLALVTLLI